MLDLIFNNFDILLIAKNCTEVLGDDLTRDLKYIFTAIEITVPILVIVLCTIDMIKAVVAQDDGEMKKAQSRAIKRIAIGLVVFFVPVLVDLLLDLVGIANGSCHIGS